MRILVVNWQDRMNPQAGGAETHLHEIFGRLADWGHEVTILASGFHGSTRVEEVDGMEVHRVGRRFTFNLLAPFYFRKRWEAGVFDVVVEDLNKVPVFMPLFTEIPVVLLVHHLFGATAFQEASLPVAGATWLLERPLGPVFRGCPMVAVSPSTAEDLKARGLDWEEPAIVPNGVDLEHYRPGPGEERFPDPTLLYVGRLKRYKRVDLILRALAVMKDRGSHPTLLIAGKGDDEPRLRGLVSKLGLGEDVEFLGYVEEREKVRLFQRSWIHVLTSPKEGWGISAMEAAACGTPTVASDSPGLRDAVRDEETGLLVPHGDVEALADTLADLLADARRRERMGRAARAHAEHYSWERSAREMQDLLENRVAHNHPQA